jgi:UTP:GlnB (protein PII) uridylyltransferase
MLSKQKDERLNRIRNYLEKFYDIKKSETSTVDVIEQIYQENMKRADIHSNLVSTRHLLGKDQYLEFKNEINLHLMRQAETARIMKERKEEAKKNKKKKNKAKFVLDPTTGTDESIKKGLDDKTNANEVEEEHQIARDILDLVLQ